jgi:hypothetical protein
MGSSVYVILLFIKFLSFPPVTSSENPDNIISICEPYGHNTVSGLAEAIKPIFASAMFLVGQDYALGVCKSILCRGEIHAMLLSVLPVFGRIPIE